MLHSQTVRTMISQIPKDHLPTELHLDYHLHKTLLHLRQGHFLHLTHRYNLRIFKEFNQALFLVDNSFAYTSNYTYIFISSSWQRVKTQFKAFYSSIILSIYKGKDTKFNPYLCKQTFTFSGDFLEHSNTKSWVTIWFLLLQVRIAGIRYSQNVYIEESPNLIAANKDSVHNDFGIQKVNSKQHPINVILDLFSSEICMWIKKQYRPWFWSYFHLESMYGTSDSQIISV